jgi:DNA-binding CsgD family transcriptional regulator
MAANELSRRQIAHRLGCSRAQVRRWEAEGKLTGRRERPEGYSLIWFPVEQVQKIAQTWTPKKTKPRQHEGIMMSSAVLGKLAARAYRLLREGKSQTELVEALEIDPLLARRFWSEYQLSFEAKRDIEHERAREERDAASQRRKDRQDSLDAYRAHQEKLAQIAAKATVEAAKEAARIAARRTGT